MSHYPTQKDNPPPYGMNLPPPGHPQAVLQQPVAVVVAGPQLGPRPTRVQCPSCHAEVTTKVEHDTTTKTHIIALILCLVGCCPCALIPYCTDSCKSSSHHCPSCGAFIGSYSS
ncbi:lipopolysaccharide-induced tumor necrosis factor-alpha factor homolog isoform X2 [Anabrus simplex]